MKFYSSISPFYDYIFPYKALQLSFIEEQTGKTKDKLSLLDIGCSTGALAIEMAKKGWLVSAIDFDQEMIQLAESKKAKDQSYPIFQTMDMLKINEHYKTASFDHVVCFGNTLVHLSDLKAIEFFFQQVYQVLNSNGHFSFQILNYSHILETKMPSLPLIDNQHIRFDRYYHYNKPQYVDFETKLTIKENQQEINNTIELFALELEDILRLLEKIGFKTIKYFSNFKSDIYTKDAFSLIVSAQK